MALVRISKTLTELGKDLKDAGFRQLSMSQYRKDYGDVYIAVDFRNQYAEANNNKKSEVLWFEEFMGNPDGMVRAALEKDVNMSAFNLFMKQLRDMGFKETNTGGGCEAMTLALDGDSEIMVTKDQECSLPEPLGAVLVGRYRAGQGEGAEQTDDLSAAMDIIQEWAGASVSSTPTGPATVDRETIVDQLYDLTHGGMRAPSDQATYDDLMKQLDDAGLEIPGFLKGRPLFSKRTAWVTKNCSFCRNTTTK